eukprot:5198264-Amphidinium_carterae.3
MTKALYGLRTSPKHWHGEHLSTILQQLGSTRSDACVFVNTRSTIYIRPMLTIYLLLETMLQHNLSYNTFNNTWSSNTQVNSQGQRHWSSLEGQLSYKTTGQSTCHLHNNTTTRSWGLRIWKCNPTSTPGNKKPPIACRHCVRGQGAVKIITTTRQ